MKKIRAANGFTLTPSQGKLVRITPQYSVKLQKKLDEQREQTGMFKSAAAYVNELIAADLAPNPPE